MGAQAIMAGREQQGGQRSALSAHQPPLTGPYKLKVSMRMSNILLEYSFNPP